MTIASGARIAALILAAGTGASSAHAQNVDCESLPKPLIYGVGGSAQRPLFSKLGAKLAASTESLTVVYASPGACFAMDAFNPDEDYKITGTANYTLEDGTEKTCQLPAAGVKAAFGSMQVGPTLCPNVEKLYDGVGDFEGPVSTTNFIVPVQSSQNAISAEAAYFVFGFGDQGQADPWTDNNLIIRRTDTSAVQLYVALATGVPASRFAGIDAMTNANSIKFVADATNKEAAIGFVSGENADDNRDTVRTLAYQHKGQSCGYWPDSSVGKFDKRNVRNGQYYLWGPTHLFATVDDAGQIEDESARRLIGYLSGAVVPPSDVNILDITIDNGNIPQCAMQVKRDGDLGPIASFQPDEPCGCYYEFKATGSTDCAECESDDDCTSGDAKTCRHGYCEVK
ncbi:MAG: hypothetical protein ABW321_12505 [Polyangiales bacterium]